jgi:DNA-binding transcriptional LysR family regulator
MGRIGGGDARGDGMKERVKTELELRHLRVFVAVVENGGHTRAARSLGVSQSTVSETLIALERTLGTDLFRKGAKGAALTRSGEALLPHARRLLAQASELVAQLAGVSADVKGTLVVAAVESVSTYVLPPRLAALREKWPGVRLEVATAVCAEIRESVAAGRSDLGLVLESDHGASGSDESVLTRTRLVVFGAPSHPLAGGGRKASADELRRCDFYMSDAAGDYHHALRGHFDAAGVPQPRTQALGTVEAVKRGILSGGAAADAVGLLPAHALKQELASGILAEVRVSPPMSGLVLRAVLGPESGDSPLVEELVRSLRGAALG